MVIIVWWLLLSLLYSDYSNYILILTHILGIIIIHHDPLEESSLINTYNEMTEGFERCLDGEMEDDWDVLEISEIWWNMYVYIWMILNLIMTWHRDVTGMMISEGNHPQIAARFNYFQSCSAAVQVLSSNASPKPPPAVALAGAAPVSAPVSAPAEAGAAMIQLAPWKSETSMNSKVVELEEELERNLVDLCWVFSTLPSNWCILGTYSGN